jgi:nucleotide-binding universal stress UspA family protein
VANKYLDGIVKTLTEAGLKARKVIAEGEAAAAILHTCDTEDVPLIAMCTHGRSGLSRTVMGSVADEVVRESHVPVLLLRPEEK